MHVRVEVMPHVAKHEVPRMMHLRKLSEEQIKAVEMARRLTLTHELPSGCETIPHRVGIKTCDCAVESRHIHQLACRLPATGTDEGVHSC